MPEEKMDTAAVLDKLQHALSLQYRSALQFAITAGSIFGFEFQALTNQLWIYAQAELDDTRRLVEKITALGGEPTTNVAPPRYDKDPDGAAAWLIESETKAIEALGAVIPHTGQEGSSEALEHLMEHIILRKQNQVDFLLRARRKP